MACGPTGTASSSCPAAGNRFFAPHWFVAGLPDMPLDGELWLGRKTFQRTVSIVRRQDAAIWLAIAAFRDL